jgi:thiol-disulfide isomerase/thioredoxin
MKKYTHFFGFIALILLFTNFSFAQVQIALSGKISNVKGNNASIRDMNTVLKVISVRDDGTFDETVNIPHSGIYSFVYARESTQIYLSDGFNLNIELNTAEFDETIKYKGKGADCNNYLASKFLLKEAVFGDYSDYKMDEKAFLHLRDSVQTLLADMLSKIDNAAFVKYEKLDLYYNNLIAIKNYEPYHRYITKDHSFRSSSELTKRFESLDYTNVKDYKSYASYKMLVNEHYIDGLRATKNYDSVLTVIKNIASPEIKEGISQELLEYLSIDNKDVEAFYTSIKRICTDREFIETCTEKYDSFQNLLQGNPSPKFAYQDVNAKMVKLDDLKGKYVYIDVWATWCGPCLGEIPHLKKLEADYHDKNIAFVSISVDSKNAYDKWKKMVADKELKGYQLYADKSWKSDFIVAYQIRGIPTFILIDPEGNIVSASAMRPSNPELRVLFDSLLK